VPKSATFSLGAAVFGLILYLWANWSVTPFPTKQSFIAVGVDCFNAAAILSLFIVLYNTEKVSAAKFGSVVRANISTIIIALLISMIGSIFDIVAHL
jgi:hypothetical protein